MTELKPCPFCGGKADLDELKIRCADDSYVKCAIVSCECGAFLVGNDYSEYDNISKEEYKILIAAWNRRSTMSKWISVKDRLPDENIPILMCDDEGISIGVYRNNQFLMIDDCGFYTLIIRPIYWKSLPKPPQEVSK